MPLFEIAFKRRISGYGGPGSSWAKEVLVLEAKDKREANAFFSKELITPPRSPGFYCWSIHRRELGMWYRAIKVQSIDMSKHHTFDTFEARVYTQIELRAMRAEDDRLRAEWVTQQAARTL